MRTVLTTLASTYPATTPPTVSFVSLDAEALPDISESYDVTAVPFLVLQRDDNVLESVSGCDAGKVRAAVEKWVGDVGAGGAKAKALPPKLEATPRQETKEDVAVGALDGTAKGTSTSTTKNLSAYAPSTSDPQTAPEMTGSSYNTTGVSSEDELNVRIAGLVKAAPVMLFMKGTPSAPQCGFSRQLVGILREKGVRYGFFNILADEDVRQGLKVWADWPTFPQLWVGGELVGGLDIVRPPPRVFLARPDVLHVVDVRLPTVSNMGARLKRSSTPIPSSSKIMPLRKVRVAWLLRRRRRPLRLPVLDHKSRDITDG